MSWQQRRLRTAVEAGRASRRYAFVLLLILCLFAFTAVAPDSDWAQSVRVLLGSSTLIAALWTSWPGPIGFRATLAAVGVVAAVAQLAVGGDTMTGLVGLLNGLLLVGSGVVIARGVVGEREVNAQTVIGGVCVYFLLGLFFAFLYSGIAELGSGPFFAQGTDGTTAERLYFSVTTQTTVGYGDFTAAGSLGRTVAMIEALTGQLYLVTVIGALVGGLGRARAQALQ